MATSQCPCGSNRPREQCCGPFLDGLRDPDTAEQLMRARYTAYTRAAMDFLRDVGLEEIGRWTRQLSRALTEGGEARGLDILGSKDPWSKAPTTAFLVPGDSHEVEAALREEGIIASARGPAVRLAPHFYSTLEDVERSLDALQGVLKR